MKACLKMNLKVELTLKPIIQVRFMSLFEGFDFLNLFLIKHALITVTRLLDPRDPILPIRVDSSMLLANLSSLRLDLFDLFNNLRLQVHRPPLFLRVGQGTRVKAPEPLLQLSLFLLET